MCGAPPPVTSPCWPVSATAVLHVIALRDIEERGALLRQQEHARRQQITLTSLRVKMLVSSLRTTPFTASSARLSAQTLHAVPIGCKRARRARAQRAAAPAWPPQPLSRAAPVCRCDAGAAAASGVVDEREARLRGYLEIEAGLKVSADATSTMGTGPHSSALCRCEACCARPPPSPSSALPG